MVIQIFQCKICNTVVGYKGILKEKSFLCDFESKFECFLHLKYNLLHNMVRPCCIIDRGHRGLDRMVVEFTTTYANENEINVQCKICNTVVGYKYS
jgi:hypothetical protein